MVNLFFLDETMQDNLKSLLSHQPAGADPYRFQTDPIQINGNISTNSLYTLIFGFCMEFNGMCKGYTWNVYGLHKWCTWNLHEMCMECVWNLLGME